MTVRVGGSQMSRRWLVLGCVLVLVAGTVAVFVVNAGSSSGAGDDTLVGAGNIGSCRDERDEAAAEATAKVLDEIPGTVFTLGDNANPEGSDADFADCYDPSWGRYKDRTRPVAGEVEYRTDEAGPYFDYFGDAAGPRAKGWYSYDQAGWHVIVLNNNAPMTPASEQIAWLRGDLADNTSDCTAAMYHHPRFSSGTDASGAASAALAWNVLYDGGVDIVLNGHEHLYERFAPMNRVGGADPSGIRAFTVGTGGTPLEPPVAGAPTWPTSEMVNRDAHGVLALKLRSGRYDWVFHPVAGETFDDSGTGTCTPGARDATGAIAVDDFERTADDGLGAAVVGGEWLPQDASDDYSVDGHRASIGVAAAGESRAAFLPATSARDVSIVANVATSKAASGSGQTISLVVRHVDVDTEYRARLRFSSGEVYLALQRRDGTDTEALLAPEVRVIGVTHTPDVPVRFRLEATGTDPTVLSAKAWAVTAAEPRSWTMTATDETPALQAPGSVGFEMHLSDAVTNAPVRFLLDDVSAQVPARTPTPESAPTSAPVTGVPANALAASAFARATPSGWGAADKGGDWGTNPATDFSVAGGVGNMILGAPGVSRTAVLPFQLPEASVAATINTDKAPTGSGQYVYLVLRRISPGERYSAQVRLTTSGGASLSIVRRTNGTETLVTPATPIPGWTPGTALRVRGLVTGAGPTSLSAKGWIASDREPTAWMATVDDGTGALQVPGSPGVGGYLSTEASNAPVTVAFDDFVVEAP